MDPLLDLTGRVALITGGGSGIGKGAALAFSEHGCRTFLLDRDHERLHNTVREISAKGGEVVGLEVDVTDAAAVQSACDQAFAKYGRLDIAFANAGINGVWAPIDELTPEEFDRTLAINLRGTFLTIKYAVPFLRRQGGSVLVTSSVNGTRTFSNTGATAYSASKAGQVALAKMLAVELGHDGIRVNVICPGGTATEIQRNTEVRDTDRIRVPAIYPEGTSSLTGKGLGTIDQVGRLALFLVSDMADHITGEVVYIDAGSSLVVG